MRQGARLLTKKAAPSAKKKPAGTADFINVARVGMKRGWVPPTPRVVDYRGGQIFERWDMVCVKHPKDKREATRYVIWDEQPRDACYERAYTELDNQASKAPQPARGRRLAP